MAERTKGYFTKAFSSLSMLNSGDKKSVFSWFCSIIAFEKGDSVSFPSDVSSGDIDDGLKSRKVATSVRRQRNKVSDEVVPVDSVRKSSTDQTDPVNTQEYSTVSINGKTDDLTSSLTGNIPVDSGSVTPNVRFSQLSHLKTSRSVADTRENLAHKSVRKVTWSVPNIATENSSSVLSKDNTLEPATLVKERSFLPRNQNENFSFKPNENLFPSNYGPEKSMLESTEVIGEKNQPRSSLSEINSVLNRIKSHVDDKKRRGSSSVHFEVGNTSSMEVPRRAVSSLDMNRTDFTSHHDALTQRKDYKRKHVSPRINQDFTSSSEFNPPVTNSSSRSQMKFNSASTQTDDTNAQEVGSFRRTASEVSSSGSTDTGDLRQPEELRSSMARQYFTSTPRSANAVRMSKRFPTENLSSVKQRKIHQTVDEKHDGTFKDSGLNVDARVTSSAQDISASDECTLESLSEGDFQKRPGNKILMALADEKTRISKVKLQENMKKAYKSTVPLVLPSPKISPSPRILQTPGSDIHSKPITRLFKKRFNYKKGKSTPSPQSAIIYHKLNQMKSRYHCFSCGEKIFTHNKRVHTKHMESPKKYNCRICKKSFVWKQSLSRHQLYFHSQNFH